MHRHVGVLLGVRSRCCGCCWQCVFAMQSGCCCRAVQVVVLAGQGAVCVLKVLWWLLAVLVLRCRVLVRLLLGLLKVCAQVAGGTCCSRCSCSWRLWQCRQGVAEGAVWREGGVIAAGRVRGLLDVLKVRRRHGAVAGHGGAGHGVAWCA